ncbi:MAG: hypothetical protein OQK80_03570 [Sedimenticola sp.]|nr:hypothetical protein [Sedimenticola sp.]
MIKLPLGQTIRTVSAPYFLVTKLEAFDGRGNSDYLLSHDMENIIAVLDGSPELVDELMESSTQLLEEVGRRFK